LATCRRFRCRRLRSRPCPVRTSRA
jgi:hypothetical protein